MKLIMLMLVLSLLAITPAGAIDDPVYYPVTEEIDLTLDGSVTVQRINASSSFAYINVLTFELIWQNDTVDFNGFANEFGGLTNGTLVQYIITATSTLVTVASISDLLKIGTATIISDDNSPAINHLSTKWDLRNFLPDRGLINHDGKVLSFFVQDNITATCDSFTVAIEGYQGGEEIASGETTADIAEPFRSFSGFFNIQTILFGVAVVLFLIVVLFKRR